MKRITYISRLANAFSKEEIDTIGHVSSRYNKQVNITGLLVYFQKMFFQIIEGDDESIDELFVKIGKDHRHEDVIRLKTEYEIDERLFPAWSMKTINLDHDLDELMRPIKILLQTVLESHSIIAQYTQPTILKILNKGINPLLVAPSPVEKIILFADIVSYSTISEKMTIKQVLLILNTYFKVCSQIIMNKGGEVNKFMGDGLMAYFDIHQADNAIKSCLDIMTEFRKIRQDSSADSPLRFLNSGFGLAQGTVIEGNMGSHFKTDYTIIGDAVNTAARLERLTREVNRSLVFTKLIRYNTEILWSFVSLGKYKIKGKEKNSEVYSIDHDLVNDFMGKNI